MTRNALKISLGAWLALSAGAMALADPPSLPTTAEVKALVDAGKYRDALKPLFRLLALQGRAAIGYDRYELLMLRAECQLQIKDRSATLATLAEAHHEAFTTDKPDRAAAPIALAFLIQRSTAYQYRSKADPAEKPIPILDRTLRPAAYAALFTDELPATTRRIQAVNNARRLSDVLEAAQLAGAVRALEIMSKPNAPAGKLQTDSLTGLVTSNADRMIRSDLDSLAKIDDTINTTANQIVTVPQGHYDPISRKSWFTNVTVRRGLTNQDVQTLQAVEKKCADINASAIDFAEALATDFPTYKELVDKAAAVKQKAAAILSQDYSIIPQ